VTITINITKTSLYDMFERYLSEDERDNEDE